MKNIIVLPLKFFRPESTPLGSIYCSEDRIYLIDDEGHVHFYDYSGRVTDDKTNIETRLIETLTGDSD